jgi:hypothetical protein
MKNKQNKTELKIIKKIGSLPYTQNGYYLCNDDNVWLIGISFNNKSNMGNYQDFVKNIDNYKIQLDK